MKREHRDLIFTVCLLALVGWAVFEARQWGIRARLFPWVIGIPLIALLLIQIGLQIRVIASGRFVPGHVDPDVSPEVARRRTLIMVGWLVGFAATIWLLGFGVGGTLATLAYLRLAARERWPISLAITTGTGFFFWMMIRFLNIPFPPGLVLEQLPI